MSNRWNSGKYAIKYSCCGFYRDNGELVENSVIKKYLTTAADGKNYQTNHYNLQAIIAVGFKVNNERAVQFRKWAGKISAEQAKLHAETKFEKYRVIQDRLFMSDYDKYLLELEENIKEK